MQRNLTMSQLPRTSLEMAVQSALDGNYVLYIAKNEQSAKDSQHYVDTAWGPQVTRDYRLQIVPESPATEQWLNHETETIWPWGWNSTIRPEVFREI